MKKLVALLSVLFLSACSLNVYVPSPGMAKAAPDEVNGQVFSSVGAVWAKAKDLPAKLSGTAFAIDKDHLLTAAHVCVAIVELQDMGILEEKVYMTVLDRNNNLTTVDNLEIEEIDEPHDVCLMKRPKHGLVPLKFVEDYEAQVTFRSKIWVVGAPAGMMGDSQPGRVMNPNMTEERIPLKGKLLVSGAATGGNSGGPVINEQGKVVGILVMGHSTYDHLSICVRAPVVQRFLKLVDKL